MNKIFNAMDNLHEHLATTFEKVVVTGGNGFAWVNALMSPSFLTVLGSLSVSGVTVLFLAVRIQRERMAIKHEKEKNRLEILRLQRELEEKKK